MLDISNIKFSNQLNKAKSASKGTARKKKHKLSLVDFLAIEDNLLRNEIILSEIDAQRIKRDQEKIHPNDQDRELAKGICIVPAYMLPRAPCYRHTHTVYSANWESGK